MAIKNPSHTEWQMITFCLFIHTSKHQIKNHISHYYDCKSGTIIVTPNKCHNEYFHVYGFSVKSFINDNLLSSLLVNK